MIDEYPRPIATSLCDHCGADSGLPHRPECRVARAAATRRLRGAAGQPELPSVVARESYVHVNAGIYSVVEYPSQCVITWSVDFARATRKARRLGYSVKVYTKATDLSDGSYILQARPARR